MALQYTEKVDRTRGTKEPFRGYTGAVYDSRLIQRGGKNADLILTLRIYFRPIDPTPAGGQRKEFKDSHNETYSLRVIDGQEFMNFKRTAVGQANRTWNNQLCLIPPREFTLFDWPPDNPTVRPNIKCWLDCQYVDNPVNAHAIVDVIAPSTGIFQTSFRSNVRNLDSDGSRGGTWDMGDTGVCHHTARQDPAFFWFNDEDIQQLMVPHEVGHLLGLAHIAKVQWVESCVDQAANADWEYGDAKKIPMWMARDIMGMGPVVHACCALPWMHVMGSHTGLWDRDLWIPAGVEIPPRAIKDIPKDNYTLYSSPYLGGFQEFSKYRVCD
jgi:hypothetical protein